MSSDRLSILSIPFTRLARVLLGEPVLGLLRQQGNVLIVSPFSDHQGFQAEFGGDGIHFLTWKPPAVVPQPFRSLYAISELLRMHGYWQHFKADRTAWHIANRFVRFGVDGRDSPVSMKERVVFTFAGLVGRWKGAWELLDRVVGPGLFDVPELRQLTSRYRHVTLIQSASWGMQDRMLAWISKREPWRRLLVPYTTDQLFCNGYLMSRFDAVCVQGPTEHLFATELHRIPEDRIIRLGSAWFRHMDLVAARLPPARPAVVRRRVIMFAGVAPTYFPRVSERVLLEALLTAIDAGVLGEAEVIYRPLVLDQAERAAVESAWSARPRLRIQWPQTSCLGIDEYASTRMDDDLAEYVSQLLEVDVVVTAGVTSLTIDAGNLGIPAISAVADATGVMQRRNTHLLFDANGRFQDLAPLHIVHQVDELVPLIGRLLADSEAAARSARELADAWDYRSTDFQRTLLAAAAG